MKKSYFVLTAAVMVIGIAVAAWLLTETGDGTEDMLYHDAAVEYGTLTVGITRTAPILVGVAEQIFDVDAGSMEMKDGTFVPLRIDEVLVSAGQQVQKGTALFRVTADSAQNVRLGLLEEIFDAKRDCKILEARQRELRLWASQEYDNEITDGKYAGVIYSNRCEALRKRAAAAKEAVDHKQNQVNENLLKLTQLQQELVEAQKYLKEAEAAVAENYSSRYDNAYYYTVYENTKETAGKMVAQLEEQIENLTEKNDSFLYEVDNAVREYHQIVMELEKEKLSARMDYDTGIYDSEMASESYNIQIELLDNALSDARGRYEVALQQIRRFNAYVVSDRVLSKYNGILADISMVAGDVLDKNDRLVTIYDHDAVTMNIRLEEADYNAVSPEESVNISFADRPYEIYSGRVTDIVKTERDGNSITSCYTVTVTIQGEGTDLYEGMSGEATFLTNEKRKVLYVPKQAVFKEGKRSFVKLRDKNGNIVEKNVTVGFSDGIHMEIVKGLSAGDVVLMPIYDT